MFNQTTNRLLAAGAARGPGKGVLRFYVFQNDGSSAMPGLLPAGNPGRMPTLDARTAVFPHPCHPQVRFTHKKEYALLTPTA